ncbi:family 43 glycosylhydrolase [Bacillus sp. A116_S68]|nr:family 43 glycosylhydrolase [Bacillus sp. A116_S68]
MNDYVKSFLILSIIFMLLVIPTKGEQGNAHSNKKASKSPPISENTPPEFEEVSVHDPSIIKVDDMFYVFGSHIEAAKSSDLKSWTNFTNGYTTPGNTLYGDLSENLAESFAWAGEDDADSRGGFAVWAPEIVWNEHYVKEDGSKGAYMMYYSASSTYIRSAIGIAVADDIEGPYTYVDTIVYSGFTEEEAYDSNSEINKKWTNTHLPSLIEAGDLEEENSDWFNEDESYNNLHYPNAIDANVFFDEEDRLWMTYGSWSGGIFIVELDKETGLINYPGEDGKTSDGRQIDRYFGTKIAGGYGRSGEGPYVTYDEETGYYYLYVTYGWLGADGGYNMRVFRAESPVGPYEDVAGQDAVLPSNTDNAPYGNKLMGNFLFERKVGGEGTGIGHGYVSPGHNSIYTDDKTGDRFNVFHTRFPETGEMHELRVHQLFMTKEDWPVSAPYRYAGESLEKIKRKDVIGDYKFIDHGKENTEGLETSVYITLEKNNKISGDVEGTWKRTGHYWMELSIDGNTYAGVFVKQWNHVAEREVMTFTALSDEGASVWGTQLLNKTDEEVVSDIVEDLTLGDTDNVISNLDLPVEGTRNATISWETSNAKVITESGDITRPDVGEDPVSAELIATISKGDVTDNKSFTITVLPYREAGEIAHYAFDGDLRDSLGEQDAGQVTGDRINNEGGEITFTDGKHDQAAVFDGFSGIRLPDGLIAGDSYSVSLWMNPSVLTQYTTTFFGARNENNWISMVPQGPVNGETMVWAGSSAWYDASAGYTIPTGEWSHLAITVHQGDVEMYINGEKVFTGTNFPDVFTTTNGQFSLGVNWWDPPFQGEMDELRIFEGVLTEDDIHDLVKKAN